MATAAMRAGTTRAGTKRIGTRMWTRKEGVSGEEPEPEPEPVLGRGAKRVKRGVY